LTAYRLKVSKPSRIWAKAEPPWPLQVGVSLVVYLVALLVRGADCRGAGDPGKPGSRSGRFFSASVGQGEHPCSFSGRSQPRSRSRQLYCSSKLMPGFSYRIFRQGRSRDLPGVPTLPTTPRRRGSCFRGWNARLFPAEDPSQRHRRRAFLRAASLLRTTAYVT
jgi:hypothetical protein